uniref:Neuromedin-K n=1 Tax=Esox lucius TaxID=8010 RepID=A0AAY5K1J9_ESOLU
MRSGLLLVALFLAMKLRSSESSCEEPAAGRFRTTADSEVSTPDLKILQRTLLKRYNDLDYDSFVGLMGRRSAGKREMDDVFVGLMGRRNSELGNMSPLRKETYPQTRRGGVFFNKCRMRFRRGL